MLLFCFAVFGSHFALQFTLRERHADAIARGGVVGVAQDTRAVLVPRERVSAAEDSERAERGKAPRAVAQLRVCPVTAACDCAAQSSLGADQARANSRETPTEIECFQLTANLPDAAFARGKAQPHDPGERERQF